MAKKPSLGSALQRQSHARTAAPGASPFPDLDAAVTSLAKHLPLDAIEPMPGQPRHEFDEDALAELAASIAERGVLQPIRVKPVGDDRYQLVAGERRWRASRRAGVPTIPAFICAPGDATEEFADALVENLLREDLTDLEVGRGLQSLMTDWDVDQTEAARRLGFSKAKASKLLALLRLPNEIQANLGEGLLTLSHIEPLLPDGLSDDDRITLTRQALAEGWGSKRFAAHVKAVRANGGLEPETGEGPAKRRPRAAEASSADRTAYGERWAQALQELTQIDVTVSASRGADGYQIKVGSHDDLTKLGDKLGLAPIQV